MFPFAVLQTIGVTITPSRNLTIRLLTPQHELFLIASFSIDDPSLPVTSSNNLLAYRPDFQDRHDSGGLQLGVIFLNLNGIFPCVPSGVHIPCGLVTMEEDGFFGGRYFVQAADSGNHIQIFGFTEPDFVFTYGLAVQGCSQLTADCWPSYADKGVTCQLPRQYCG